MFRELYIVWYFFSTKRERLVGIELESREGPHREPYCMLFYNKGDGELIKGIKWGRGK